MSLSVHQSLRSVRRNFDSSVLLYCAPGPLLFVLNIEKSHFGVHITQ